MILIDSDVAIDIMRGFAPALEWLKSSRHELAGIPGLVMMEMINGCRNQDELDRLHKAFRGYRLYWPNDFDCKRALIDFQKLYLSQSLGLLDSLIAETAIGIGASLASYNIRHFCMLKDLTLIQPYTR
ncbi:MAG: VapC toxin family PIN domain ribonuclease [Candidatus Sumerlaeota bacterium]|nr:VapC toxin family PIN domain ribonuclease [Candidatus Sumerlaeota bacterium]